MELILKDNENNNKEINKVACVLRNRKPWENTGMQWERGDLDMQNRGSECKRLFNFWLYAYLIFQDLKMARSFVLKSASNTTHNFSKKTYRITTIRESFAAPLTWIIITTHNKRIKLCFDFVLSHSQVGQDHIVGEWHFAISHLN